MALQIRNQTQRAVEPDKRDNLIFIGVSFCVFLLKFVFTQWPATNETHQFFCCDPLNTAMTWPTYIDYSADCWTYIIIYFTMMIAQPKTKEYIFYVTLIWLGYYVEYYFTYNNIGFSYFLGVCFPAMFLREIFRK